VRVPRSALLWGAEYLSAQATHVVGVVLRLYSGEGSSIPKLEVDFGGDLGILVVPAESCEDIRECNSGSSDSDWAPGVDDLPAKDEVFSEWGFSDGEVAGDLLCELGTYDTANIPVDETFLGRYADKNWHNQTLKLLDDRPSFCGPPPGPTEEMGHEPIECFHLFERFWDETMMRHIVAECNRYAMTTTRKTNKLKCGPRWEPITLKDFRAFLGIVLLMGIKDLPCIRDYWRISEPSLYCPIIASVMSRDRFEQILRCLHLVNKDTVETDKHSPLYDPLIKCRWLLEALIRNSQALQNADEYLCVDESIVAYAGRYCAFKQYIPSKPTRYGIKVWMLCCSTTKYCYVFEVYVGKTNTPNHNSEENVNCGSAYGVVSRLTSKLRHRWHTVAMDNFFTSPRLFEDMLASGFYCVGTARANRKGFPTSLNIGKKSERGTLHVRVHRDRKMAAVHWTDCKGVCFLSTGPHPVEAGLEVPRRVGLAVTQVRTSPIQTCYTKNMRGVDVQDQLRTAYSSNIASKKWWHKLFFFCLDTAVTNTYILYRETCARMGERPRPHKHVIQKIAFHLLGMPQRRSQHVRPPPAPMPDVLSAARGTAQYAEDAFETVHPNFDGADATPCITADGPIQASHPQERHGDAPDVVRTPNPDEPSTGGPAEILVIDRAPIIRRRRTPPAALQNLARAHAGAPRAHLHYAVRSSQRRKCVHCGKRTTSLCRGCNSQHVCMEECFQLRHANLGRQQGWV
jgi:hypothetical protein